MSLATGGSPDRYLNELQKNQAPALNKPCASTKTSYTIFQQTLTMKWHASLESSDHWSLALLMDCTRLFCWGEHHAICNCRFAYACDCHTHRVVACCKGKQPKSFWLSEGRISIMKSLFPIITPCFFRIWRPFQVRHHRRPEIQAGGKDQYGHVVVDSWMSVSHTFWHILDAIDT